MDINNLSNNNAKSAKYLHQPQPQPQAANNSAANFTNRNHHQSVNRFPIIEGQTGMSNLGANQAVGRRLDQVQTRRCRMKNARAMKVLYYYVDEVF